MGKGLNTPAFFWTYRPADVKGGLEEIVKRFQDLPMLKDNRVSKLFDVERLHPCLPLNSNCVVVHTVFPSFKR